ncbi:hypothetical protein AXF43_30725 [Bacillus paranthracis]|nr:hypothetical protein [Bacillus paranthracis]
MGFFKDKEEMFNHRADRFSREADQYVREGKTEKSRMGLKNKNLKIVKKLINIRGKMVGNKLEGISW